MLGHRAVSEFPVSDDGPEYRLLEAAASAAATATAALFRGAGLTAAASAAATSSVVLACGVRIAAVASSVVTTTAALFRGAGLASASSAAATATADLFRRKGFLAVASVAATVAVWLGAVARRRVHYEILPQSRSMVPEARRGMQVPVREPAVQAHQDREMTP